MAEVLRKAAGEGRLDLQELDERLEATFSAKTYADLAPITADLPVAGAPPQAATRSAPAPVPRPPSAPSVGPHYTGSFAMLSETKRSGVWSVGPSHTAFALMGSVVLDLREASFQQREVVITANAVMGGVDIYVNAWTQVVVEGMGIMGDFSESRSRVLPEVGPQSPVVRVRGVALMGAVNVKRKSMPGETKRRLLGR